MKTVKNVYTVKELNDFLKVSSIENLHVNFFYGGYNTPLSGYENFIGGFYFNKDRRSFLNEDDLPTIPSWMNDMKIQQISFVMRDSICVKILLPKNVPYFKEIFRALNLEFFEIPKTLDKLGRAIYENGDTDKIETKLKELISEHNELVKMIAENLKY